jgi:glycosyltransferase involved in cell wall biosynthesis
MLRNSGLRTLNPKLSILIATIGRRNHKFQHLIESLIPQLTDDIEIVVYWNNGETTIGKIRQYLLEEAIGEYVCFIDDDDEVPDYYCKEILAALGEDYVGFQVELYNDGTLMPPVFHSIKHREWRTDYDGYYRGVTHLNPIRRSIALRGDFSVAPGAGEDAQWSTQVTPHVQTENYIARTMYRYYHESLDTNFGSNDGNSKPNVTYHRPAIKHPNIRHHPDSKLTSKDTR